MEFDKGFKKMFRNLTPLMYALFTDKYEISKLLLKNGAIPDYDIFSLFHHLDADEELIQLFINAEGFDINKKNAEGKTYLDQAIHRRDLNLVKILLDNGAVSNSKEIISDVVAFAIGNSNTELLDLLIQRNLINSATLNIENFYGKTPLITAVRLLPSRYEKSIHILQILLNAGADINLVTSKKICALSLAETFKNKEIYEFLLNAGAKPLRNAIHTAIENNKPELIVPLLSSGDLNINEKDFLGFTPLELAIKSSQFDLMKKLIEWGADLSIVGSENYPIFYDAMVVVISNQDIPFLKSLLAKHDFSLDYITPSGATLLHFAVKEGNDEILKILLSHGAKPDIPFKGITPALAYAIQFPHKNYQNVFEPEDFTEVFLSIKTASHAFELDGQLPLNNQLISLEGLSAQLFAKVMSDYISLFEKQFSGLNEKESARLQDILDQSRSRNRDPKIMFDEYQQGKGILIHTGFFEDGEGHAVSCYIFDEYIIVGNKGLLSKRPLEIYKINKEKVCEEFFMFTEQLAQAPKRFYKHWIDHLAKELDGVSSPLTTAIEKAYPMNPNQLVGNCAWESTEATLFGIIALHRALEAGILDTQAQVLRDTQKTYVEMTQFFQLESFENYLKKYLCEYHQFPKILGDRDHYLSMKHSILQEISHLPKIFSQKIKAIKALLVQVDQRFNP
jgi:ankyrin repeat protein